METNELLDGESLTGTHAAIVFGLWIGLVIVGAFVLTFAV
jgi:tetrahydromethanopterin S-methyltransferase subunit B